MGLKTRILVGFLAILVVFAGAGVFTVSRMQGLRDDLRLIHRGFLAMNRLATQVRTLQEAKDEYVRRALTEEDQKVRGHLVGYARTFYPKALRDRLAEVRSLAMSLKRHAGAAKDRAFLEGVRQQVERAQTLHDAYDEATAALLVAVDLPVTESTAVEVKELTEAYQERSDALSREIHALGVRTEAKLAEAVLRAERTERESAINVVLFSLVALLVSAGIFVAVTRGLRPLSGLVESARQIARGSLDVEIPTEGPVEVAALAREFSAMARSLRDRERSLAAQHDDVARLKAFSDDVIRSVQVGIVVLDAEGRVRTFNPAARGVFGLPLVDVEGRALRGVEGLSPALVEVLEAAESVRQTGEPQSFPLHRVGDKVVDIGLVPIRDRAGASSSDVLVLGEDVSDREEARSRLVESERLAAIGRLAAQITHEIRNPLSSIGLNIELLGDDVEHLPESHQAEARAILQAVGREVTRLTQITEGYLRYTRLPAPQATPGDVGDVLADLAAFNQGEAEKLGVMLELQVEEGLPDVPHDPPRLRQALLNLLRNAQDAAGRGGTVRLRAVRAEDGVQLTVEDSGPGLDEGAKAQIFEPFFTTKPSGTGLGLTLALQIVREHGGELVIEDSPLGGAQFSIRLPMWDGAPASDQGTAAG